MDFQLVKWSGRRGHKANLLPDSKALIAGGYSPEPTLPPSPAVSRRAAGPRSPSSNICWTEIASLPQAWGRVGVGATPSPFQGEGWGEGQSPPFVVHSLVIFHTTEVDF